MTRRRLAAATALAVAAASGVLAVVAAVRHFPNGLSVLVCIALAISAGWYGVTRRGAARIVGLTTAGILVAGSLAALVAEDALLEDLLILAGIAVATGAAAAAFAIHVSLPSAPRPRRPVLFMNPHSGGGKATRFHLAEAARARGIEPVELRPG